MLRTLKFLMVIVVMLLVLAACDSWLPFLSGDAVIPITGDEPPPAEESAPLDADEPEAPEEVKAPTETPTTAPTSVPPSPTPTSTPTTIPLPPPPEHVDFPDGAIFYDIQRVSECQSGGSRVEGEPVHVGTGCDIWAQNMLERPLDISLVNYNPNLDIVEQEFGNYEGWFYARMLLYHEPYKAVDLNNTYGIEIDLDIDSDGDLLILVTNPQSLAPTEWSTERVSVWQDHDDDVGGVTPVLADDEPFSGTGYEVKLFENGYGEDPDLAWARISPGADHGVEFAFKDALIGEKGTFQWWMWASKKAFLPRMFDYVDSMQNDDTYEVDVSCRWLFGIPPQDLPNICPYYKPPPERPPGDSPGRCVCPPCPGPDQQCPPCSCP